MKYIVKRFSILFIGLIFLTACGSKVDLSDYVEVQFDGYDTIGTASYFVDDSQLIQDSFGITMEEYWEMEHDKLEEINNLVASYSVVLSDVDGLSNGDE